MPKVDNTPNVLLPYIAHGVDFNQETASGEARGACVFCQSEDKKFYVNEGTGLWSCHNCKATGNVMEFLRRLQALGRVPPGSHESLASDRGLLRATTLKDWEVSILPTGHCWTIPGYSAVSRGITQIYRYLPDPNPQKRGKKRFVATTGLQQALYGVNLFDDSKPDVFICEGPWDAMALQEVLSTTMKTADENYTYTPNEELSLLASSNVLAAPGSRIFNSSWNALLGGKRVFLMYDNDHPRVSKLGNGMEYMLPADAYEGMKAAAKVMSQSENPPAEVHYLRWGKDDLTYDPELKSGYDLRDALCISSSPSERAQALGKLLKRVEPIPSSWLGGKTFKNGSVHLECLPCDTWRDLTMSWRRAARWTSGLDCALACMLAAVVSTGHVGDQLWLKVISCASSGKTMLCESISVARDFVLPKSTTRGFHSGYKSDKDGSADHSLIPLLRGKTLVTKDGDTLLSSPAKDQILSEGRDLYDRVSRSHYKNGVDRDYEDVPMTWILCGTGSLRTLDSSELGERFLTVSIMDEIDADLERQVARRAITHLLENRGMMVNGTVESRDTIAKTEAKRLTGGYVEYLRKNATKLYQAIDFPDEAQERCLDFGEFVAYMRARPSKKQDELAEREFSVRLCNQLTLLALSLAVVLNRKQVDDIVMNHVGKVAVDTARGRTLEIVGHLFRAGAKGANTAALAIWTGQDEEKEKILLSFLKRIKVAELFVEELAPGVRGQPKWRLTPRVRELYALCIDTSA